MYSVQCTYILWQYDMQPCNHLYFRHDSRTPHRAFTFWPRVGEGRFFQVSEEFCWNFRFPRWLTRSSWAIICRKDNTGGTFLWWFWSITITITITNTTTRWIVGSGSHAGVYPEEKKFRKPIVEALDAVPGDFYCLNLFPSFPNDIKKPQTINVLFFLKSWQTHIATIQALAPTSVPTYQRNFTTSAGSDDLDEW